MKVLTVYAHPNPRSFSEHVYSYRVPVADDETRRTYLERAYKLGREFAER